MSDQINLPSLSIPELHELITNSVKSALAASCPSGKQISILEGTL